MDSVHPLKTGWFKLDDGVAVDVVFLDFKKAFDTVSHPVLIKKLGGYGVDTHTVKWVAN